MPLPRSSRIVIVGGGIAGCSTAYHLALLGERDVLLLEQGKLTCGTTWHAAGLVGQMRPNRTMTRMSKYGIELYRTLEAETGLATGWKQCGSVNVAQTRERPLVDRAEVAAAVMDDRLRGRRQHLRRHGRRTGREEVALLQVAKRSYAGASRLPRA